MKPVSLSSTGSEKKNKTPTIHEEINTRSLLSKFLSNIVANINFVVKYVTAETIKKGTSSLIGLITVIVVVFVVSFIANVITKTSVIFTKLAIDQVGDFDFSFSALISKYGVWKRKQF